MWIKKIVKVFRIILMLFVLFLPFNTQAQPYACTNDELGCPDGCKADGVTCWDPDDPVPLDNEVIFLIAIGLGIGLYKLSSRRTVDV